MARRTIKTVRAGVCKITIARDSFDNEFVVSTFIGGKKVGGKGGGYFTHDKQDARNTAAATIRQLRRAGRC